MTQMASRIGRPGRFASAALLVGVALSSSTALGGARADQVEPMLGSGGIGFGVGALNPGPSLPHGMVKLGPDTTLHGLHPGWAHCGGYWYPDPEIRAFTHTHPSGIGVADYGNIGIMPVIGYIDRNTRETNYRSAYSHDTEVAEVGYYAVTLSDSSIRAELTAGQRAGLHRYTFPAATGASLVFDPTIGVQDSETLDAMVDYDPARREITGYQHSMGGMSRRFGGLTIYFVAQLDRAMPRYGVWEDGVIDAGQTHAQGTDVGVMLGFDSAQGDQVQVRVGLSYISVEQARLNLEADMPGFDFEAARLRAEERWEQALEVIDVEGGSERERRIFYSTLYRTTGMPTDFTEVGGVYLGFDGLVRAAEGFHFYSDLSLWDTYRTVHPLYNLIYPETQRDVLVSLGEMYLQSGTMPRWPLAQGDTGSMIGSPADILFADSYLKGIRDFDVYRYWTGLGARHGWDTWVEELGYYPSEAGGGSVSKHLEYAHNDFALAVLADQLGYTNDAQELWERSLSYANLFNEDTGFFQPRAQDGTWGDPFWPHWFDDAFTEGNAWQLLWFVPHDMDGLVDLMGGPARFASRLNSFFERSARQPNTLLPDTNYWHGNEPDIQAAWLFNYVGRPDLTARWVRWVLENKYTDGPDGLDGNDDGGTLSAWYVFSSMGLYPTLAQDIYLIGSPLFERSTLHLAGGDFEIVAPGASAEAPYVQSATLNGVPLLGPWLRHADLVEGGNLTLHMGATPSSWGTAQETWPPGTGLRR